MSVPSEGELIADRYRIERGIGRGAMGAVFAVRDERSNRKYALKWIDAEGDDERVHALVQREIKALQLLQHPAILQLFDHGANDSGYWVLTELLAGKDLLSCVEEGGVLDGVHCAAIGAMLCSALAAAHAQGIVHRDVKPGNLFLCDDGRFILLDFGVAKASEGARTDTMAMSANTVLAGTVSFLSPELVSGGTKASPASDLFAVGGTLQWLLTATLPFPGTTILEMLGSIAQGKRLPIQRKDLPPALIVEIDRTMAIDPATRPEATASAQIFTKIAGGETAVRQALVDLAQRKPIATGGHTQIVTSPRARLPVGETPRPESKTQIATDPAASDVTDGGGDTRIVTTLSAQTNVVTNPGTSPGAQAGSRGGSLLMIGVAVAAILAGVGIVYAVRHLKARPTPVVTVSPPPVKVEPPPSPNVELPPPTAPDVVDKPPPVETPPPDDAQRPGAASLTFEHWVELSLDGKALGRKEFATRLTLSPGKHVLVAEHPKFGTRRFPLDVKAGRSTSLHIDLSRTEKP